MALLLGSDYSSGMVRLLMVTMKNTKKIHLQRKHTLFKNCDNNLFLCIPVAGVESFMMKGLLLTPKERSF